MRLIDANTLRVVIPSSDCSDDFIDGVNWAVEFISKNAPTAYDAEAVVTKLEEMLKNGLSCSECNVEISYGGYCFGNCEENAFAKAIEIVRNGGKEQT